MPRSANCWTASGSAKRTWFCRQERHLHHAEATINYYNHQLVGLGSGSDLFTAIHGAAEKLEKQAVKARTKWRDNQAHAAQGDVGGGSEPAGRDVEAEPDRRMSTT